MGFLFACFVFFLGIAELLCELIYIYVYIYIYIYNTLSSAGDPSYTCVTMFHIVS